MTQVRQLHLTRHAAQKDFVNTPDPERSGVLVTERDSKSIKGNWIKLQDVLDHTNDVNYKIACFHAYFGNEPLPDGTHKISLRRGGSVKPTVLTAKFLHSLSASNLAERRIKHPSFVRLAELLEEIRQLEQDL